MVLLPRTPREWVLFVAAPLLFATLTRSSDPRRNYGRYQMAHGVWGAWATAKGLSFLWQYGLQPFRLGCRDGELRIDPAVCQRWLREFGLYLLSEGCWAAAIGDRWMLFQHHLPILLFYKFAQDTAVTQPLLIAIVECVNIPIFGEGLMRWLPILATAGRAQALRLLKLALVLLVRVPLNATMFAMTFRDKRAGGDAMPLDDEGRRTKWVVRLFSVVWLWIDSSMAWHLLRGIGWSDAALRQLSK